MYITYVYSIIYIYIYTYIHTWGPRMRPCRHSRVLSGDLAIISPTMISKNLEIQNQSWISPLWQDTLNKSKVFFLKLYFVKL